MEYEKYKTVYIIRYNNGEMNFKFERTVVNGYELMEAMGEAYALNILKEVAIKVGIKEGDEEQLIDITEMSFKQSEARTEIRKLIPQIWEHWDHRGADDGTFDYFPDLIYAFQQICEAFKCCDIYNEVATECNEKEYNELGEPFEVLK